MQGTAMGFNVAEKYTNFYMTWFYKNHVYGNQLFLENVHIWLPYIDDIYFHIAGFGISAISV